MRERFQLLLCLLCLFFPFISLHALNIKSTIKDCTCNNNGYIKVEAINPPGGVLYALDYYDDSGVIQHYASGLFTPLNYSSTLDARVYLAKILDQTTGKVDTVRIELKNLYVPMVLSVPTAGKDITNACSDNGLLTVNVSGGSKPYIYKVTNTDNNTPYTYTSDSMVHVFKNLPTGNYSVRVTDACGEAVRTLQDIQVQSGGNQLQSVPFTSLDISGATVNYKGSSNCLTLSFILNDPGVKINNNTTIPTTYSGALQYIIEYPAGSGNYSPLSQKTNVLNKAHEIVVYNFDRRKLDYKIGVVHPCTHDTIFDPGVYQVPTINVVFTVKETKYVYNGFCSAESGTFSISKSISGIDSFTCGTYPYTVHVSSGTDHMQMTWTNGTQVNFDQLLDIDYVYKICIINAKGDTIYLNPSYQLPNPGKGAGMNTTQKPFNKSNFIQNCDFNTATMQCVIQQPLGTSSSVYENIAGSKAVAKIISGPTTARPPIEIIMTEQNKKDTMDLWNDLPFGTYVIDWTYYADANNPASVCRSNERRNVTLKQYAASFQSSPPVISSILCNKYTIKVEGSFVDASNNLINSRDSIYKYAAYLIPDGATTPIARVEGYNYNGSNFAQFVNVDPGKYTIKVVNGYARYSETMCVYATYTTDRLPGFDPPTIDPVKSGGISCLNGTSKLTVVMLHKGAGVLKYSYKKADDLNAPYSAEQTDSVFTNLVAGTYSVLVSDSCGNITKVNLSIYDGTDQFLEIEGELDRGTGIVCRGSSLELSVRSVGPILSYTWYKNNQQIPGATTGIYMINNVSESDIGVYKVKVYNGECDVYSSIEIKEIQDVPHKPIIEGCGCDVNPPYLSVINHELGQTYNWYYNGTIIPGVKGATCPVSREGVYTAIVTASSSRCASELSDNYLMSSSTLYWKDNAANPNWNDAANWVKSDGTQASLPPGLCTEVHIGNSDYHPSLDSTVSLTTTYGVPACNRIIFHYGGLIYSPERLKYNRAIVQYNFGYYNGNYTASTLSNAEDLYPSRTIISKAPILRGGWQLIAAPLKKIVAGDFALAGYPMTWQSYINIQNPETGAPGASSPTLTEANFTEAIKTNDIELSKYNNAMALKVTAYENGKLGSDNHKYLENLKGIISYPYYEDTFIMSNRPGTSYSSIRQLSTLYYFNVNTLQAIYDPVGQIKRSEESYRFIFESDSTNQVDTIRVAGIYYGKPGYTLNLGASSSNYVMIGNPFISRIVYDDWYNVNSNSLAEYGYYTFDPVTKTWILESIGSVIEPLQAIVVKLKPSVNQLIFPMSLTHNINGRRSAVERASVLSPFIITLKDENQEYRNKAILAEELENVEKIVSAEGVNTPEVYFISQNGKCNLIQNQEGISEIGIGIKSANTTKPITFSLSNTSQLDNIQPILIDKVLNNTIDMNRMSEYTFYQRSLTPEKQYADNTRFVLQLHNEDQVIDFDDITIKVFNQELSVVSYKSLISNIIIYDMQGRTIIEYKNIKMSIFNDSMKAAQGIYIVKVMTIDGTTKSQKVTLL